MKGLSKLTYKVNPIFLSTLQKVYIARAQVFNKKTVEQQNVDSIFNTLNNYQDGQGYVILSKFDELFNLHKEYPRQQYELLNTSYVDSLHISSINEASVLIKEIDMLIGTFEQKRKESPPNLLRVARNKGGLIEMPIADMFKNWSEVLRPFTKTLNQNIENLKRIPLGAKISSQHSKLNNLFNSKFFSNETELLKEINKKFSLNMTSSDNRIVSLTNMTPIAELSGTTNNLATVCLKLANDTRFYASGPRSGFGEISLPENEPGSSIMPGKVNPTQCNNSAITFANGAALFESNNFKPVICNNILRSLKLLSDGLRSFRNNCAVGIVLNEGRIKENVNHFLH